MNRAVALIPTQASSAADIPAPVMGRTPSLAASRIRDWLWSGGGRLRPTAGRAQRSRCDAVPRCDCSGEGCGPGSARAASTCSAARIPLRNAPSMRSEW